MKSLPLLILFLAVSAQGSSVPRALADFFVPGGERLSAAELACRRQALSAEEIVELRLGRSAQVPDRRAEGCPRDRFVFLTQTETPDDVHTLRALAIPEDGFLRVKSEVWPLRTFEAPICPDCDEVWIGDVLLDERSPAVRLNTVARPGGRAAPRAFPVPPGFENAPAPRPFAPEKWAVGRRWTGDVLFTAEAPTGLASWRIARELKKRGASRVVWHWSGLRSRLPPHDFEPRPSESVRLIDYDRLRSRGEPYLLVDASDPSRRAARLDPFVVYPEEARLERESVARDLPIVVFGLTRWRPEAFELLRRLEGRGYKKLFWYPGGVRDWRERETWDRAR